MKTNVCKIALMFLIGTALSLLFNSCSKDPVIPENETDNKLHEDPSKMTIRLVGKRLRDSILSPFFHSYIFAMYKNEALWI